MLIPCTFKLVDNGKSDVAGNIIGIVSRLTSNIHYPCNGTDLAVIYTVDALVMLRDFDAGKIYQVPMHRITVSDQWVKMLYSYETKEPT